MKKIVILSLIASMLFSSLPITVNSAIEINGFQGVSWKQVVPVKRISFVGFNEESYLDDFSYLASIPANVFYDTESGNIISNPLLYYEHPQKEKTLNGNEGINYFMEDWMNYCGNFDQIQLINIDPRDNEEIKHKWNASSYLDINQDDPFESASEIALANWETSNVAIVASIEDHFTDVDNKSEGSISGIMPGEYKIKEEQKRNQRTVGVLPQHNHFKISDPYKYVKVYMTWNERFFIPFLGWKTGVDPDLQLYDPQIGMVDAAAHWLSADEEVEAYIHNYGEWSASVTYMPTQSLGVRFQDLRDMEENTNKTRFNILENVGELLPFNGRLLSVLSDTKGVNYKIDITLYPGKDYVLPISTPYGCRDAIFSLECSDADAQLGLILEGPSGEVLASSMDDDTAHKLSIDELGEGNYSITVLKLDDYPQDTNFNVKFSWKQKFSKEEGEALHSAAQGAVLASLKNAPLLYASSKEVQSVTQKSLEKLDVDEIYYINLGGYGNKNVIETLKEYGTVTEYVGYIDIFKEIQSITGQNDLIFTTINPWSYWKIGELQPAGEKRYGCYIGPATYAAAHHGSPLLITDIHPDLSCPVAWHNQEWLHLAPIRDSPHVGGMVLTGNQVWNFIKKIGFDGKGQESMLTVAGQFDIGTTWDRMFPGVAYPGRIIGTPVDTSYWISRNIFYPALIYENPAMDKNGVWRITGSTSERTVGTLNIKNPEREIRVNYPFLQSWVNYNHRFNEVGSEYWGLDYTTVQGLTPFHEPSPHPVDDGVTLPYQEGQYYPDMAETLVIPFYANKLGYNSIYSTNFPATIENLNRGVIWWMEVMHGFHENGGSVGFWKENKREHNPWRGYEPGGSTENPDTINLGRTFGYDVIPASSLTGYDGIVIASLAQYIQTKQYLGTDFDEALKNVHSAGFVGASCLISNTMLHLALIRHGFVFQIIDPWKTSWYVDLGFELLTRELIQGTTIGEAYGEMIRQIGIGYMTEEWWWDTLENIIFFGDPDLVLYSPYNSWDEPMALSCDADAIINGHSLLMVENHPGKTPGFETMMIIMTLGIIMIVLRKRK